MNGANKTSNHSSCINCPAWESSAFSSLDADSLEFLRKNKEEHSYSNDDVFSEKGKPATEVFCLKSGAAKVHLMGRGGAKSIVRLVAPGDMLGYRCIFSASHFRGTASSIEHSSACTIPKNVIFELIERSPSFSKELLSRMGKEIASAESRHQSFCQKNVRERLAEALLILKEKFGRPHPLGFQIGIYLRRTELANWIGTAKETVIRTLSEFKDQGLIVFENQLMIISDITELQSISEPQATILPRNKPDTDTTLRR